jgi:hypothetical protein
VLNAAAAVDQSTAPYRGLRMNVRSLLAAAFLVASLGVPSLAGAQVQIQADIHLGTRPRPAVVVVQQPPPPAVVVVQPAPVYVVRRPRPVIVVAPPPRVIVEHDRRRHGRRHGHHGRRHH